MFLTDRKLERRISELQEYRYRDVKHLESFAVAEETQGVVNPELPKSFEGWDELCVGDTWKGRDRFLWMHREIEIPAEWNGKVLTEVRFLPTLSPHRNRGMSQVPGSILTMEN